MSTLPAIDEHLDLRDRIPGIFRQSGFTQAPSYDAARMAFAVDAFQRNGVNCQLLQRPMSVVERTDNGRITQMEIYMIQHQGQMFTPQLIGDWDEEKAYLLKTFTHALAVEYVGQPQEVDCRDPDFATRVLIHWEREGEVFNSLINQAVSDIRAGTLELNTPEITGTQSKPRTRI